MLNEVKKQDGFSLIEVLCVGTASNENITLAQSVLHSLINTGKAPTDPIIVKDINGVAVAFNGDDIVGIISNEEVKKAAQYKGSLAAFFMSVEDFSNNMITYKVTVFLNGISGTTNNNVHKNDTPIIVNYGGKKYQRLFVKAYANGYNTARGMHITSEMCEKKDPLYIPMAQVYAVKEDGCVKIYGKDYDRSGLPMSDFVGDRHEDDFIQDVKDSTLEIELDKVTRINGFISDVYVNDFSNSKLDIEVLLDINDYSCEPQKDGYDNFDESKIPQEFSTPFFFGKRAFFGIDLDKSPNYAWRFKGVDTTFNGEKDELYEANIYKGYNAEHFFPKCELSVIGDRRTVIHFPPIYDRDSLYRDVPFCMLRDGMYNGKYAYTDFLTEHSRDLYGDKVEKEWKKDEYTFKFKKEDGKLEVWVYIDKVYDERPDYDGCRTGEFKPDRKKWLAKYTSLLESAVMVGSYFDFVAGTADSVKNDNMFMFEPSKQNELSLADALAKKRLNKGDRLVLVNNSDNADVYVMTEDREYKFGIVPTMMDIPVSKMVEFGFIKNVTVLSNDINLRVLVTFDDN